MFKLYAFVLTGLLLVPAVNAQNSAVVIPLPGDDIALAQQNFRYRDTGNSSANQVFMCETEVFNTPNQETQVLLIANANARFSADSAYWYLEIQFSKDSGNFANLPSRSLAFAEASSDSWSQLSATNILDLDPNSSYQFRLDLNATQSLGTFSSTHTEYCELIVSATFKLPAGRNILEIEP